jgi:hypothetical protein
MKDLIKQSKDILTGETLSEGVSPELEKNVKSIIKEVSTSLDNLESEFSEMANAYAGNDVERDWMIDYFNKRIDELFTRVRKDINPKSLGRMLPRDNK